MMHAAHRSTLFPYTTLFRSYEAFASNRLTEVGFEEPAQVALMGASAFNANSEDLELVFPTPVKEGFEFKYWINWSDETFERSEEHTSELQSRPQLVCRLLLE